MSRAETRHLGRLASWLDVDALRSLDSLRSLRLTNIPLFQGKGASEVRPLIIARIPQLKFLNGSSISEKVLLVSICPGFDG